MSSILFGMEVPTRYLDYVEPLLDLHFVIATYLVSNKDYYTYYTQLETRKTIILDNGMYEEGTPMSGQLLLTLAREINADYVIAPDQHPDKEETVRLTDQFLNLCEKSHFDNKKVILVPQGENVDEVLDCWNKFQYWGEFPIALSFLNDRPTILKEGYNLFQEDRWYHNLGLYNICEIVDWPKQIKSMDTVKPFKAALHNKSMLNMERGLGKWHPEQTLPSYRHEQLLADNIQQLKEVLKREDR